MSLYHNSTQTNNDDPFFLPEVVLVLGKTGVGKSTFIKAATGLDIRVEDSLHSGSSFLPMAFY